MNIALLHYAAPPVVGGVETVLARQAQQLKRSGHQVLILAGRGQMWDVNIPVRILPHLDSRYPKVLRLKSSLDSGVVPEGFSKMVEQIQNDLKRHFEGIDVVIAHNVASLHKNLALTAALHNLSQLQNGPRVILWHHDLAWTSERYRDELHSGWPWDLLRNHWCGVHQVTVSKTRQQELAALMGLNEKEIQVVPAGLDVHDFLGLHHRTIPFLEKLDLLMSAPIILTPVRITRRKNLELAIRTMAALIEKMPDAILIITGPPGAHNPANKKYFKKLHKLRKKLDLEGKVHLMADFAADGLPDVSVADFYRLADALLIPSREEGFGIPILEAGLSRMPIFCSDIPQLRALAGDAATYFSPDDPPEYIAGLIVQRMISDSVYQWRVKVRREYTWEAIYKNQIAPLLEFE